MKKYIVLIFFCLLIFGCEKDDICIEDTTPNLIIRFYDKDNMTEKKLVSNLTVWITGKTDSLYQNQTIDSIAIPLDLNINSTSYNFKSDSNIDAIDFNYTRNDIFVSRSCGYKTVFENLNANSTSNNWINTIIINNETINNETAAHISIYH